jgi:hypothetical protein
MSLKEVDCGIGNMNSIEQPGGNGWATGLQGQWKNAGLNMALQDIEWVN